MHKETNLFSNVVHAFLLGGVISASVGCHREKVAEPQIKDFHFTSMETNFLTIEQVRTQVLFRAEVLDVMVSERTNLFAEHFSTNWYIVELRDDTNAQLVLLIENPTTHVVLFDDPRFSRTTRFDWELTADQEIIAHGGRGEIVRAPLLAGHLSTGPVDLGPGRPFKCDLSKYYPDLGNGMVVGKANSLLWYCRLWDQTATNWIQASGMVRLK